jgi:hypothetical protein
MLDLIVDRREMKATIASALRFMGATQAAASPVAAGRAVAGNRPRRH